MQNWFVARNGKRLGPYTSRELKEMACKAQLQQEDVVLMEGAQKWVAASSIPGLFQPKKPRTSTSISGSIEKPSRTIMHDEARGKRLEARGTQPRARWLTAAHKFLLFLGLAAGLTAGWFYWDSTTWRQRLVEYENQTNEERLQANIAQAAQINKLQEEAERSKRKLQEEADQWAQKVNDEVARWKKKEVEEKEIVENLLLRLRAGVTDLIPLLTHKNGAVNSVVRKLLGARKEEGADWALLNAMASPDADLRAAYYLGTVEVTRTANVPALEFWKEASVEERDSALAQWREAVYGKVPPVNKGILDFTFANYGKQVNNGECAMLVSDALKAAKGQPIKHKGKTYVWGRALADGETAQAGDIVQLEDAKFTNGVSAPHHTQIIRRAIGPGHYDVLEQNAGGRRTVGSGKLNLKLLAQGTIVIYRPLPLTKGVIQDK